VQSVSRRCGELAEPCPVKNSRLPKFKAAPPAQEQ
jgi:hypothetical protein